MTDLVDRRTMLRSCGVGVVAAVAGCGGSGSDAPEFLPVVGGGDESESVPEEIDEFLKTSPAAPNYNGSMYVADAVKTDFVNIYVGQQEDGGPLVFEPAAVQIPPSSEVRWNWMTGDTEHAVESIPSSELSIDSGEPTANREDYQVAFDEEGICLYECPVHGDEGMKGGIVVTADPY